VCLKPLSHLSTEGHTLAYDDAFFNSKLRDLPTFHFIGHFIRPGSRPGRVHLTFAQKKCSMAVLHPAVRERLSPLNKLDSATVNCFKRCMKTTTGQLPNRFASVLVAAFVLGNHEVFSEETNALPIIVNPDVEPVATGKFQPTWESLKQYQVPGWFRDAKFGIWAHWGPQCEPEDGDWYGRNMYVPGSAQNKFHVAHYGSPSQFGFKDVIHEWKAENWDPEKLLALYQRAGAQYFFALADHHDNFDNWDSKYQPWNSVNVGPHKDLIGGWAKAAHDHGLRFGVSVHATHAWTWYEPSQKFDGKLTKADGAGQWWDGLDPQDLYAQNHEPGKIQNMGRTWNWPTNGDCNLPDAAYCQKFYNRTIDLIDQYHPDLIYFDDTVLPLYPVSDAGLKIAAHFYNRSLQWHGPQDNGVLFGKALNEEQRRCMVWDIERGAANEIEPLSWQTDTCLGDWHYDRKIFENHRYKSVRTVIQTLADVVSKNGNLLLSVPVRADGTIDSDEIAVVEGIAKWMKVNRECIFGTRPWQVFGEGPASMGTPINGAGFNEGKGKPLTASDFRFTVKGDTLYAIELGWPTNGLSIRSLGQSAHLPGKSIGKIKLLGSGEKISWQQNADALVIAQPKNKPNDFAIVFKITMKNSDH
jgi:alpha-L-fucosidase